MKKQQKPTDVFDFEKQVRLKLRSMEFHKDIISKYNAYNLNEDDFYMLSNIRLERNSIHCKLPKYGQELKSRAAEDHKLFKNSLDAISASNVAKAKVSIEKLLDKFEKVEF